MVTFVGADSGGGNVANINTATDKVTWPAGIQNGDIAFVFWICQNNSTPTTTGWTVPSGGSFDGNTGASRYRLMWRVCDGTESGNLSLTNATATINRQAATLVVYRGLDTTNPIDVLASPRDETVSGTTHANPSVTTATANAPVATAVGERATTGTNAWTPPASYTERADSTTAATGSGGTIVAWADDGLAVSRASGATVTPGVWTSGNSFATTNVVTWTLSLKPGITVASGSASLSASGTLTAAGKNREQAAATLTASGATATTGLVHQRAAAALTGAGTLTASARVRQRAAAALTASGTLTAAAVVHERASAALAAGAVLTAAGLVHQRATVSLAANAVIAAGGAVRVKASATLTASGALTASGIVRERASATLTASGALTVAGTVRRGGQAALSASGSLTAAGRVRARAAANLSAQSDLVVSTGAVIGSASLSATSALTAAGRLRIPGIAALAASATLTAAARLRISSAASLSATAALTVTFPDTGPSRGSMSGRPRSGSDAGAAVRTAPDVLAAVRSGPDTAARRRAGASMGGS